MPVAKKVSEKKVRAMVVMQKIYNECFRQVSEETMGMMNLAGLRRGGLDNIGNYR